jgi:hypothetical protein
MLFYYKEIGSYFPVYYKQGTSGIKEYHFILSPYLHSFFLSFFAVMGVGVSSGIYSAG